MGPAEEDGQTPFHVFHKVPAGDGLYVRAKHAQLVERNQEKAVALFWASLEAGDRVDSALKDLAIVLKQRNRPQDAILAITAFRTRCSESAQDSLDNVLLDLYKSSGRLDDQIALLIQKLKAFQSTHTFNGKLTKTARSQGKKFQVSVEQETARLLGNLGWAYMQQSNYHDAESVYRRALALEADINKVCNLGVCLMRQGKAAEAIAVLKEASFVKYNKRANTVSYWKSYERAMELIGQASTMLRYNGSVDDVVKTSSCESSPGCSSPTSWHKGAVSLSQFDTSSDRMRDVRAHSEVNNGDARRHAEGSLREVSSHLDSTTIKEMENMGDCDPHDDRITSVIQCLESKESRTYCLQVAEEHAHFVVQAPVSTTMLSNSLLRSQMQAKRRLPVFQDITVLGSAAA